MWISRKIQYLFPIKFKERKHYSCVIYNEICRCKQSYVGETVRNAQIKLDGHDDIKEFVVANNLTLEKLFEMHI